MKTRNSLPGVRPAITIVVVSAFLTNACARPPAPRTARTCTDLSSAEQFFHPDTFVPRHSDVDDELRETLARYFQAANEMPWACGEVPTEGYRLFVGGGYGLPAIVATASG